MKRLAVLVSGNGSNLQAIIDACKCRYLNNCKISLVLSNNNKTRALERAKQNGIVTQFLSQKDYETREQYDTELTRIVSSYKPDLVVLAGWMRILTSVFINRFSGSLINLHPSMPGGLIGADCLRRGWYAHRNGELVKSGCMIHHVIEDVDMGEPIATMSVPFKSAEKFEDYEARFSEAERSLLVATVKQMTTAQTTSHTTTRSTQTQDTKYPLLLQGKVREIYELPDKNQIAICHSDRLSAFNRYICDIPDKGNILSAISEDWFKKIEANRELGVKTHYVWSRDNVIIAKRCKVFPIEFVVRAYMTGNTATSIWTMYNSGKRDMYGINWRDGYKKNERLDEIVITPTTKSESDSPISLSEILEQGIMTPEQVVEVTENALRLFKFGEETVKAKGLILVDTKYEFGLYTDPETQKQEILLVDEVHTCDSSRYWKSSTYGERFNAGLAPDILDKDVVRNYIKQNVYDPYTLTSFDIPEDLKTTTANVYRLFYNILTVKFWKHNSTSCPLDVKDVVNHSCEDYTYNENIYEHEREMAETETRKKCEETIDGYLRL
jgi:phosphoribosylaminoimidazole-succinocarboxamide synthase